MTGDVGEIYNAMREAGKERRHANRAKTPELLKQYGVAFDSRNDGAHLIVTHGGKIADLWPGTGKYQVRGTDRYRRGVFNLLRDLGVQTIPKEGGAKK